MLIYFLSELLPYCTAPKQFAAGFGAGLIEAVLVVVPVETVKTKVIRYAQI